MVKNLFDKAVPATGESYETLLKNDDVTIELIVSSDQPEPILYHQPNDEAVLLLEGEATLWIDGRHITLKSGDFLHIPAKTPHKVLETSCGTRWLAIHTKAPLC
ncbi:cupin domain-containing protein [Hydrogenimonas urashimensis]|uniref:cupin domain-containing protein n=1 Tax=Hydrogenimonas urashimensis TaxID=2740515 RepID=UPI001915C4F8|nr:cupin domain-containing protein [Hydrogenimonas urashimensis]